MPLHLPWRRHKDRDKAGDALSRGASSLSSTSLSANQSLHSSISTNERSEGLWEKSYRTLAAKQPKLVEAYEALLLDAQSSPNDTHVSETGGDSLRHSTPDGHRVPADGDTSLRQGDLRDTTQKLLGDAERLIKSSSDSTSKRQRLYTAAKVVVAAKDFSHRQPAKSRMLPLCGPAFVSPCHYSLIRSNRTRRVRRA